MKKLKYSCQLASIVALMVFTTFLSCSTKKEITDADGSDGSYIMQAKGKHSGGGGSADPAICLYLAKPVYTTAP